MSTFWLVFHCLLTPAPCAHTSGLACDEDNQPEMSEDRVKSWVAQIKKEGMPL